VAREAGLEIIGINSRKRTISSSLKARDQYAAKVLADATARRPDAAFFVLIGDLHLASSHLPASLKREIKRKRVARRVLTIHQNYEPLYWKLVDVGAEEMAEVVRIEKDVYCLFNTPPWIKLQSHLHWIESTANPPEWDYTDEIPDMVSALLAFFEIKSAPRRFEDYEAHSPGNSDFMRVLKRKHLYSKKEWKMLLLGLDTFGFQLFPKEKHLYALTSNPNHWAELSARYLHAKLSGWNSVYADPRKDFYSLVMIEAVAFLSSKILNPKRKSPSRKSLKEMTQAHSPEGEAARLTLSLLKKGTLSTKTKAPVPYLLASMYAGKILGEEIYVALLQNRIRKEEVKKLFFTKFPRKNKIYSDWVKKVNK
jgi:hypothetical protein